MAYDARLIPFLPAKDSRDDDELSLQSSMLPMLVMPDGEEGEDAFEKDLDLLFDKLHKAMWQVRSTHPTLQRNPLSNYKIFAGELDSNRHRDVIAPWSAPGMQVLSDYSFFSANENILNGMLQQAGQRFATRAVGPAWEDQKRTLRAKQGAEETLRMVSAQSNKELGTNVAPALTDESLHVPESESEWTAPLPEQQQLEMEVYERLNEALKRGGVERKLLDTFRDKFIVNVEIAHIFAQNGQPVVEPLRLDEVTFWGKDDAEDADDMDAWAIRKQITVSQLIAKYGTMLEEAGTKKETLRQLAELESYPTEAPLQRFTDGTLTQLLDSDVGPLLSGYDSRVSGGMQSNITEQVVYVKLISRLWFEILTDVNLDGKPSRVRPLTKEEYDLFKKGRYTYFERTIYNQLTETEAKKKKNEGATSIRMLQVATLYHSVRVGRKVLFRRPLPWQEREPGKLATPSFPIKASFGKDTSLVTKGTALHELYTNVMISARKLIALSGIKAMGYDASQLPKGYTLERVMWEAKEAGIVMFNGQRISSNGGKEGYKHLQPIDLGMDDSVTKLIAFAGMLHDMYDRLCGITPALKGIYQSRETDGQTQLGVSKGTLATNRLFYEHSLFVEDVYNGMVSLGKYLWPRQKSPRAKGATIDTVRELPLHYYGVYLENTLKGQEDKNFIMQMAQSAVSSGAASLSELMQIYLAESPTEALAVFESGLTAYEKSQQQLQQSQSQAQQAMAEAAQAKVQIPIQVAQIAGQFKVEVEKMRQEYEAKKQESQLGFQGDLADVTNQANLQQTLVKSAAQQEAKAAEPQQTPAF